MILADEFIRAYLRENPDGASVNAIADALQAYPYGVRRILQRMPDAYIDRWTAPPGGPTSQTHLESIWRVVVPPPNCPRPKD